MTNPVLAVTQPDGSRKYVHPLTGEMVPSITTIIKGGIPQPWMGPWAAKMAAEHANAHWDRLATASAYQRITEMKNAHKVYADEKADIGDIVHDLVDCWSTGRPYPDPPKEVRLYIDRFIDFLTAKRPVFVENEVTLWSRAHGYAGTADFIIEVDGRVFLADLKTGKNLHEEIGLQLSALAHCDFILRPDGTEEPIPEFDGIAGLHLRPRSWRLKEVNEPEACFSAFLAAKDIMDWTLNVAPKVLGLCLKNKAWIVDIDGTLALMNGRGPFDWSRVGEDLPNEPVVRLVHAIDLLGDAVIFMSGRMEQARFQTEMWLAAQIGFFGPLYMRKDDDFRPDTIVKRELYDIHVKPRYDVIGVIDDRASVCRQWREMGLTCLQVAEGDF